MRYAEFHPSPGIAQHVRCIWVFESGATLAPTNLERIVPDGCPELVIHYGAPFSECGDGSARIQPQALFAGQLSRPLGLRTTGGAGVIGVRFHPAAARRIAGVPLGEMTDARIALTDLWPRQARSLVQSVLEAPGIDARVGAIEAFIAGRLARRPRDDDPLVMECAHRIESTRSRVDLDDVVGGSGIGRRQLERRFRDSLGVSPGLFFRIVRFRGVFDALSSGERWADAAASAGYFDQSHLIRDFHRFVGCSPTKFAGAGDGLGTALLG